MSARLCVVLIVGLFGVDAAGAVPKNRPGLKCDGTIAFGEPPRLVLADVAAQVLGGFCQDEGQVRHKDTDPIAGRVDLFVRHPGRAFLSRYSGSKNGLFGTTPTFIRLHAPPTWLAVEDLNNDHRADIVYTDDADPFVKVRMGTATGNFLPPAPVDVGNVSFSVAVADFDGDGFSDMLAGPSFSDDLGDIASIAWGRGDGTFAAPESIAVNLSFTLIDTGDFNGDGKRDAVLGRHGDEQFQVLHNRGNRQFMARPVLRHGALAQNLLMRDVNQDGRADVLVNDANGIRVLSARSNGDFREVSREPTGGEISAALLAADFNGDGLPDLAFNLPRSHVMSYMEGLANATFKPRIAANRQFGDLFAGVADVNGDGLADYITQGDGDLGILFGRRGGPMLAAPSIVAGRGATALWLGDGDGDGVMDIVTPNLFENSVSLLSRNNGEKSFKQVGPLPAKVPYGPFAVAAGVFDANQTPGLRLAVLSRGDGGLRIVRGGMGMADGNDKVYQYAVSAPQYTGDGPRALRLWWDAKAQAHRALIARQGPQSGGNVVQATAASPNEFAPASQLFEAPANLLGVGELLGVGQWGIVAVDASQRQMRVVPNPDDAQAPSFDVDLGPIAADLQLADMDGDGRDDIVMSAFDGTQLQIFYTGADGAPGAPKVVMAGLASGAVRAADFNGDDRIDLAVAENGGSRINVLLAQPQGQFMAPLTYHAQYGASVFEVADLDGDGLLDIVTLDGRSGRVGVLQQTGCLR